MARPQAPALVPPEADSGRRSERWPARPATPPGEPTVCDPRPLLRISNDETLTEHTTRMPGLGQSRPHPFGQVRQPYSLSYDRVRASSNRHQVPTEEDL